MSHYIAWQIAALGSNPVMILEDDAKLEPGWETSVNAALSDAPLDTDFIFVGHCGAAGAPKTRVVGNLWDVKYPSCFHCYLIWPEAAQYMMETMRKMFGPVDLMTFVKDPRGGSKAPFDKMKVLTILPRKVSQFNTEIPA